VVEFRVLPLARDSVVGRYMAQIALVCEGLNASCPIHRASITAVATARRTQFL